MIENKKIICLIPAKKNSIGLKNKNILPLKKKPLIDWTFRAAKKSKYIDDIMVSTDSKYIFKLAKKNNLNVPFLRPKKLARSSSSIFDVIVHSKKYFDKIKRYDILILLQPTSPFRTSKHIDLALKKFIEAPEKNIKKLISVYKIKKKYNWTYKKINDNYLETTIRNTKKIMNRQDYANLFLPNGAIYIYALKKFKKNFFSDKVLFFQMDKISSIDIDNKEDYKKIIKYRKILK